MSTQAIVHLSNDKCQRTVPIDWIKNFDEVVFNRNPNKKYLCFYTRSSTAVPNFSIHQLSNKFQRHSTNHLYMGTIKELIHAEKETFEKRKFTYYV